jgi:hypothetical protein
MCIQTNAGKSLREDNARARAECVECIVLIEIKPNCFAAPRRCIRAICHPRRSRILLFRGNMKKFYPRPLAAALLLALPLAMPAAAADGN